MGWVRLDDDFADHPKLVAAGPLAGFLWICGIAYANRHLTDGFIPAGQVGRLADVKSAGRLAERLVAVGLWEPVVGGYRVHDYLDYQTPAGTVLHVRRQTAKRVENWRNKHVRNAARNGVTNGDVTPPPRNTPSTPTPQSQHASPPTPPPQAEGGGDSEGIPSSGMAFTLAASLCPPTEDDRRLWDAARERLGADWLPANRDKLAAFELVGRQSDGGLVIQAPAWAASVASEHQLAACLVSAGDPAGAGVVIVRGQG